MSFKATIICASAFFVQITFGQYIPINNYGANELSFVNSGSNLAESGANFIVGGLSGLDIGSSGPLVVTSISPIGPSGLAVASENVIEGVFTVNGQLPFLSAVAFEGVMPTAGTGVATCGCGSGSVGTLSEDYSFRK